ncbi:Aste57867_16377 [Aphanomyces stellatus]|uniref:Aste57867_16377 protein n=1 Tax=Aphanomyces stellatus TaxID=120398 RepID=A0A485L6J3_9STRA|nr:hypothetical protein As57867_016320 [Aphanomyces stellatus]VFT93153.1 Aste57867_16377 [Aphanomyces stellatus]
MQRFQDLDKERAAIEAEMQLIGEELCSGPSPIGLKGPLVDSEGFPRADIDVYNVRHKRHRFACLQTDLKWKMKEIEDVMAEIYAEKKALQPPPAPRAAIPKAESPKSQSLEPVDAPVVGPVKLEGKLVATTAPFARVESVQDGSPSNEAGLLVGDLIIGFGSATAENHRELAAIREIVGRNINTAIDVVVARNEGQYRLTLVPHQWSGQGVLGCHIIPIV